MGLKVVTIADIHIRTDDLPVLLSWNNNRLIDLTIAIIKLQVDEVWIIGDLFDRSHPSMGDIISATHFVKELGVPVKYINGNHERITKDLYTLHLLKNVLDITPLDELMEVDGVTLACIGHESLYKIKDLPPRDLLLSHFRWSHDVFGVGELRKKDEKFISENFRETILGDIHFPYEPMGNVRYISSPYSINYSKPKDYGVVILKFDDGDLEISRVKLDLPCKIGAKLALSLVNGFIDSTSPKHLYKLVVSLRYNQLEDFKKLKPPNNIELIPKFITEDSEVQEVGKIEVGSNIKDVLLNSLKLPEEADKLYIKDIIKDD